MTSVSWIFPVQLPQPKDEIPNHDHPLAMAKGVRATNQNYLHDPGYGWAYEVKGSLALSQTDTLPVC
jgi:hypothetical protein